MVKGILFFLYVASSWASLAADRAAAQTLPDGCPDLQGTYCCDNWNSYHGKQAGHFQRFERIPDPDPARNATIYRVFRYNYDSSDEEAKKQYQRSLFQTLMRLPEAVSSEEAEKRGGARLVADGKKLERTRDIWGNKDHVVSKCEGGTLSLYSEVDIHTTSASWYLKGNILVKEYYRALRSGGNEYVNIYPCKKIEGNPEAAAACNNRRCSWSMDEEKGVCYRRLCADPKKDQDCFIQNCGGYDWSKPTAHSTASDRLDEAVEERKTKINTPHDTTPAPQGVSDQQAAGSSLMTLQSEVDNEPLR